MSTMQMRLLGNSGIQVTPVAMGCWPIAGMTSIHVNDADSLRTLQAAFDSGINFFDTAFGYGVNGESERLIAQAFQGKREQVVLATKCGMHWDANRQRVIDGAPKRIQQQVDESLRRLATEQVDLLYLHMPDPAVPVQESAAALRKILEAGKARAIGVSNFSVPQLDAFQSVCPITACQPHYNMLQREIEEDIIPWCQQQQVAVVSYWPLMKGLLAGKLSRDHVFDPRDGRQKYPMFQGAEWEKNQDFVDTLRAIAAEADKTVAQVVVNWTCHQPGITSVLCGAKRAYQIEETAASLGWQLSEEQLASITRAISERGAPITRSAV